MVSRLTYSRAPRAMRAIVRAPIGDMMNARIPLDRARMFWNEVTTAMFGVYSVLPIEAVGLTLDTSSRDVFRVVDTPVSASKVDPFLLESFDGFQTATLCILSFLLSLASTEYISPGGRRTEFQQTLGD